MDVRALPRGRRKELVALVPAHGRKLGQRGCCEVNGVPREMRIGDVPLDAFDRQRRGKRAAPAVLDHVAQALDGRGLAHDAEVDPFVGCRELFNDFDRAVDRRAFLVGSDQQRDGSRGLRMRDDEAFHRGHERRQRALHVRGAAAVEPALALRRHERIGLPSVARAGGHDIGVSGEADQRTRGTAARPQVRDAIRHERFEPKAERRKPFHEQRLASGIVGGYRRPRDQRACEVQRGINRS